MIVLDVIFESLDRLVPLLNPLSSSDKYYAVCCRSDGKPQQGPQAKSRVSQLATPIIYRPGSSGRKTSHSGFEPCACGLTISANVVEPRLCSTVAYNAIHFAMQWAQTPAGRGQP